MSSFDIYRQLQKTPDDIEQYELEKEAEIESGKPTWVRDYEREGVDIWAGYCKYGRLIGIAKLSKEPDQSEARVVTEEGELGIRRRMVHAGFVIRYFEDRKWKN